MSQIEGRKTFGRKETRSSCQEGENGRAEKKAIPIGMNTQIKKFWGKNW
jgi:hypothetical protein